MPIQKIKSGRVLNPEIDSFIGNKGQLFFDEDTGQLRLSDGVTAGGISVSGSGNAITVYSQSNTVTNNLSSLNFIGSQVLVTNVGNDVIVSINGIIFNGGGPGDIPGSTLLPAFLDINWDGSSTIDLGGVT